MDITKIQDRCKKMVDDFIKFSYENSFIDYYSIDKRIETFKGSLKSRIAHGFPVAKNARISEEEIFEEVSRVKKIADKLVKANKIANYFDVDLVPSEHAVLMSEEGIIAISPLFTKQCTDDQLAYDIGHELAHYNCKHQMEKEIFDEAVKANNKKYKTNDSLVLSMALEQYHELEADIKGCVFAVNAGFHKPESNIKLFSNWFSEDTMESDMFAILNSHPSFYERDKFLQMVDYDKEKFTKGERVLDLIELRSKLNRGESLEVEQAIVEKIAPVIKMDTDFFIDRIKQIENSSVEKRITLSHSLDRYKDCCFLALKEQTIAHRKPIVDVYNNRLEALQEVANHVCSSFSVEDENKFYMKQLKALPKKRIPFEVDRYFYNLANKAYHRSIVFIKAIKQRNQFEKVIDGMALANGLSADMPTNIFGTVFQYANYKKPNNQKVNLKPVKNIDNKERER